MLNPDVVNDICKSINNQMCQPDVVGFSTHYEVIKEPTDISNTDWIANKDDIVITMILRTKK